MKLLYFKTKKNQENMSIKDILKKDFWNSSKLILKRFKSSKLIFIVMWLLFFTVFFLFSNFPDSTLLAKFVPIFWIGFIISILLLSYYFIKIFFIKNRNVIFSIVIWVILIILWIILSITFLIDNKTLSTIF